ncbi:MAG: PilZ domain-containing protein [Myxococcota bacterium]
MQEKSGRRRDARIRTQFETLSASGTAVLTDISYSGALLGETSVQPDIGSVITLYVFLQPVNPIELAGEVVRHTENGFAIEYKDVSKAVRRLVDDAAAIVRTPPKV